MDSNIQKEVQSGTSFETFWFKKIQIDIDTDFNVFYFAPKKKRRSKPITDLFFLQGRRNYLTRTPYLVPSGIGPIWRSFLNNW